MPLTDPNYPPDYPPQKTNDIPPILQKGIEGTFFFLSVLLPLTFALVSQRHSANGLQGNFCVRSNENKTAESCRLMLDSGRRHKSNSLPRYLFTP